MTDSKKPKTLPSVLTYDDVRAVSPALEHYTKGALLDGLWRQPDLTPRDRSVVTVAALIARIQTIEMPFHFSLALDNGVNPRYRRGLRDGASQPKGTAARYALAPRVHRNS
jgi:4-carboxymuconolactone decarboxylase